MLKYCNSLGYDCLLYMSFIVLPFFISIYKFGYLLYTILIVHFLEHNNDSYIAEYLYKNKIVKDIKYHRIINFATYSSYVIPFSYIGFFYINYNFATIFINIIFLSRLYTRFIKKKQLLIFTIKNNDLIKIDNYPIYLKYSIIKEQEPSNNIDDNILNIIIKGDITVEYKNNNKIYKNIYISHNDNYYFEVIMNKD